MKRAHRVAASHRLSQGHGDVRISLGRLVAPFCHKYGPTFYLANLLLTPLQRHG